MIRLLAAIALLMTFGLHPAPANAQLSLGGGTATGAEPVALPDPLTPETVRELVARMSDDQVRDMLLDRLDAVAKAEAALGPSQGIGTTVKTFWRAFVSSNVAAFTRLPDLFSSQARAFSTFAAKFTTKSLLSLFASLILALIAGLVAERIAVFLTRRWRGGTGRVTDASLKSTLGFLLRRFFWEVVGLIAFFIVVNIVAMVLIPGPQQPFAAPFLIFLVWVPRLGAAFSHLLLAPNRPDLRLVNVDDRWAKYLHHHQIGLFFLIGFSIFIIGFNEAMGLPVGETRLGFWLNLFVHIYIIFMAWTAREGLVEMMRGSDPDRTEFDERVAAAYPYFAVLISVGMWVIVNTVAGLGRFDLLLNAPHYTTMFLLLLAPAFDTAIRGLVRHLLPPMVGDGAIAEAAYRSTKRGYIKIGRVIVSVIVILLIADAWQIDLRNLAAAGVGSKFAGQLIEFLMLSAVGYVIFELVTLWINRRLAKEQTTSDTVEDTGGEGGGAGGSRLTTVLPLIRVSVQVAIAVIFGLVALDALGVDTTPLLAGAGILGLAIGFGAQKLVTDIVSGIFFLIDDAFRVGEYVDIGGTMGVVEKISIRSMQLRHHRGLVHTVPYGEIPKLTNFSRDWVIMKLKFTVPFDADPNKIKKVFKKIGAEMMEDPIHKDGFLEPFKSQGVFEFNDVGMVMRGKFMAKPGMQFTIRKEIYNRVKKELEAVGIPFARREVRVAIPGLEHAEDLDDEARARVAATAAAAEVARQQQADTSDT